MTKCFNLNDEFLDKGYWTPQTVMLRRIQDWVFNCVYTPTLALSIDSNPQLENIFLKKWPSLKVSHATFPEVDACNLQSFADYSFDLVFSHQVLEHINKPWIAAEEMMRVLKPGGIGIHTTCAFNPRHGQPHFNDYYRFLKEGLEELFSGATVLSSEEWGNREAILYNVAIDDGHGALGGRRFHESIGSRSDSLYPWVTWIICQKEASMRLEHKRNIQDVSNERTQSMEKLFENKPVILEDSHGIKFILRDFEKNIVEGLISRACDNEVFAAYQLLLKPGDVVFDVGAHVGRYSVFPSKIVGPQGIVHAFEPVEDNYWQLRVTLALNQCENVRTVKSAIGDKTGEAEINLFNEEFSSWSSLGKPEMTSPDGSILRPTKQQAVECQTIDDYCRQLRIRRINFLKIDVEGFELSVLQGAQEMLKRQHIDYICFEISANPLKAAGVSSKQILEFLEDHGYKTYSIQGPPYKFIGPVRDIDCFHNNFYASHYELSKRLESAE
jgi:FkbM family methyltransferase